MSIMVETGNISSELSKSFIRPQRGSQWVVCICYSILKRYINNITHLTTTSGRPRWGVIDDSFVYEEIDPVSTLISIKRLQYSCIRNKQ